MNNIKFELFEFTQHLVFKRVISYTSAVFMMDLVIVVDSVLTLAELCVVDQTSFSWYLELRRRRTRDLSNCRKAHVDNVVHLSGILSVKEML